MSNRHRKSVHARKPVIAIQFRLAELIEEKNVFTEAIEGKEKLEIPRDALNNRTLFA